MNLNPVKQYADVVNGVIHIRVPEGFDAKRVELTIVPLEDDTSLHNAFQQFLLDSPEMSDDEFNVLKSVENLPFLAKKSVQVFPFEINVLLSG